MPFNRSMAFVAARSAGGGGGDDLSDGIVAAWNFNNSLDADFGGFDLTATGTPVYVPGKILQAVQPDFAWYASVASATALQATTPYTIAFCFYCDGDGALVGKYGDANDTLTFEYMIRILSSDGIFFVTHTVESTVVQLEITPLESYLCVAWNDPSGDLGIAVTPFSTGIEAVSTTAGKNPLIDTNPFYVGDPSGGGTANWIDSLVKWDRVLSAGERESLYNSGSAREFPYS